MAIRPVLVQLNLISKGQNLSYLIWEKALRICPFVSLFCAFDYLTKNLGQLVKHNEVLPHMGFPSETMEDCIIRILPLQRVIMRGQPGANCVAQ